MNSTWRAGALFALASFGVACGTSPSGETDHARDNLQKGANCIYEGVLFEDGDELAALDGCNRCRCGDGTISCTKRACVTPIPVADAVPPVIGPVAPDSGGAGVADASAGDASGPVVSDAGPSGCFYGGVSYPVGASFPSRDKCNSCFCGPSGAVACTKKACPGDAGAP